ncbi:MAG: acetate kinase [Mesorhizobium amorphae]|nr:MAG: acetate kinase [Mesorhizobium amorphae]
MTETVLALNCGSSSVKFGIFDTALRRVLSGDVEGLGAGLVPRMRIDGKEAALPHGCRDHRGAIAALLELVGDRFGGLAAVGHRIVHGGTRFTEPVAIDAETRAEIAALAPFAPAHQPHNLAGIDAVERLDPALPQVAVFDTAFHRTIPLHRQRMALPARFAAEGLLRFGFHGISYQSLADRLPALLGDRAGRRVILCHLGNGCSLAGLVEGHSVYTTMGFTPLDGLMMGRRPGRLDPGAVLWLVERHGGDWREVGRILNQEAGLLGVSGITSDMRDLLSDGSETAGLAVAMFVDRLAQEVGGCAAALGGIDALVFTGGIGENASPIRAQLVEQLGWLGLGLDAASNSRHAPTISSDGSSVSVHVLPTEEERVIAQAAILLRSGGKAPPPRV